jgi:hypothetical protein
MAPHCTAFWLLRRSSEVVHQLYLTTTYHETPPRIAIGVQPVPMGTFRPEISTPISVLISVFVKVSTWLEFFTSLQHIGVDEPELSVATATAARARMGARNFMVEVGW